MYIRIATIHDAAALAVLTGELGYSGTPEDLEKRLTALRARGLNEVFVACDESDRPVGWINVILATSLEAEPRAELAGLVVSSSCRGEGVGKALMARAEGWAASQGVSVLRVRTNAVRADAHAFYEHLGYGLVKQQRVYEKGL